MPFKASDHAMLPCREKEERRFFRQLRLTSWLFYV
jgi:hypothetical protein